MAWFEALYVKDYRSPMGWFKVGKISLIGSNLVLDAMEKVKFITKKIKGCPKSSKVIWQC